KTLHHKETSVVEIFPEIDHDRIVAFIDFFKKVIPKKNTKLKWLQTVITEMENNFY